MSLTPIAPISVEEIVCTSPCADYAQKAAAEARAANSDPVKRARQFYSDLYHFSRGMLNCAQESFLRTELVNAIAGAADEPAYQAALRPYLRRLREER